jgi:hypothetical protein
VGRVVVLTPPTQNRSRLLRQARDRSGLDHATFAQRLGALIGRPQLGPGAIRLWEDDASSRPPPAEVIEAATTLTIETPHTGRPTIESVETGREPSDLVERLAAAKRVDDVLLDRLQADTDSFRHIDRQLGTSAVTLDLATHLERMTNLWSYRTAGKARQRLATAVSEAAALAGWQALDQQQLARAWEMHELAKHAAAEGDDRCAQAFATAQQALILLDLVRVPDAVVLVRSAKQHVRRLPPRLASWLHSAEAEVLATAGQPDQARHALTIADTRLPATLPEPDLPYVVLDQVHLARWRGSALAQLGDESAIVDLSTAVLHMDSTFTRAGAGLHSDLALALARTGEIEHAAKHITQADDLANAVGSARQRRRIGERAALIRSLRLPMR